jgi:hypothetical protein
MGMTALRAIIPLASDCLFSHAVVALELKHADASDRLHPSGRCPYFPFSDRNRRHRSRLIVSPSRNGAVASYSAFKIAFGNSIARVMPRSVRTSTISY